MPTWCTEGPFQHACKRRRRSGPAFASSLALFAFQAAFLLSTAIAGTGFSAEVQYPRSAYLGSLLERSYVRCVRESTQRLGYSLTDEQLTVQVAFAKDDWTMLPDLAVENAPTERIGRLRYIKCSWFLSRE